MTNLMTMNAEIVKQLDDAAKAGLASMDCMNAFQRCFQIASATQAIATLLTDQVMAPIMALQGKKLGFKTDKMYPVNIVRNCLIEAVLTGVYPTGNHFNIIAGNMYITKEGFGYLLSQVEGLKYMITPKMPEIVTPDREAKIEMELEWSFKGKDSKRTVPFSVKINKAMGADAIIGKATRKARAWLHAYVTGFEISEGDIDDSIDLSVEKPASNIEKEPIFDAEVVKEAFNLASIVDSSPISVEDAVGWLVSRGNASKDHTVQDLERLPELSEIRNWILNNQQHFTSQVLDWIDG